MREILIIAGCIAAIVGAEKLIRKLTVGDADEDGKKDRILVPDDDDGIEKAYIRSLVQVEELGGDDLSSFRVEKLHPAAENLPAEAEIISLAPGRYRLRAHRHGFPEETSEITISVETGKYYTLSEDGGRLVFSETMYDGGDADA